MEEVPAVHVVEAEEKQKKKKASGQSRSAYKRSLKAQAAKLVEVEVDAAQAADATDAADAGSVPNPGDYIYFYHFGTQTGVSYDKAGQILWLFSDTEEPRDPWKRRLQTKTAIC